MDITFGQCVYDCMGIEYVSDKREKNQKKKKEKHLVAILDRQNRVLKRTPLNVIKKKKKK